MNASTFSAYPEGDPRAYKDACADPFEFIPVEVHGLGTCPPEFRDRLMVDSIHDGDVIPAAFLVDARGERIPPSTFLPAYEEERDWGASMVAGYLAQAMGLSGHYRVNIARVLMDYGRFPGMTRSDKDHLGRFAINFPFSELLSYEQKRSVLQDHYDHISDRFDQAVRGRLIKLSIHTYDRRNKSGTLRPQISLVTRAAGYQNDSRMPFGLFDAMYPDELGEVTCNRMLRDRISLTLERAGLPVAHNYPYLLPEGSIEVRAQVWFFFDYLRRRFEEEVPLTREDQEYGLVWAMLLDTNLRSSSSEAFRSYLHMFRRAPKDREGEFKRAQHAYEHVRRFLERDNHAVVRDYRRWSERPSSLAIEVRKDMVWEFDEDDRPLRPRHDTARRIGQILAHAIGVYLKEDLGAPPVLHESERQPWYFGHHG